MYKLYRLFIQTGLLSERVSSVHNILSGLERIYSINPDTCIVMLIYGYHGNAFSSEKSPIDSERLDVARGEAI